jgi:hypothetical protein
MRAAAVRIQGERRTRASRARRGSKGREKVGAGDEDEVVVGWRMGVGEWEDDGEDEDEDEDEKGEVLRLRWMALRLKSVSAAVMARV